MAQHHEGASLGDMFAQAIDSAKAYARAEVKLVRTTVKVRLLDARWIAVFGVAAAVFGLVALIILFAALGLALGHWLGPAGGMAVAGLLALLIAGLLAQRAMRFAGEWNKPT